LVFFFAWTEIVWNQSHIVDCSLTELMSRWLMVLLPSWPNCSLWSFVLNIWQSKWLLMSAESVTLKWLAEVVKWRSSHWLQVQTHCLRLFKDSVQTVNQVVMVLVALEHIEARKHELVLLLDQLVQQLDVVRVTEVIASKTVYIVQQLVLLSRKWRLGSLNISAKLCSQSC
jgi:hypothetical protein